MPGSSPLFVPGRNKLGGTTLHCLAAFPSLPQKGSAASPPPFSLASHQEHPTMRTKRRSHMSSKMVLCLISVGLLLGASTASAVTVSNPNEAGRLGQACWPLNSRSPDAYKYCNDTCSSKHSKMSDAVGCAQLLNQVYDKCMSRNLYAPKYATPCFDTCKGDPNPLLCVSKQPERSFSKVVPKPPKPSSSSGSKR